MRLALEDAGVTGRDVVHVNAHATSTPVGDGIEAAAIRRGLGSDADHVTISATKSMTGHMMGAAGSAGAAVTALTLAHGKAAPTTNHDESDPAVDLDVVPNVARDVHPEVALCNAFALGGINCSLVLARA